MGCSKKKMRTRSAQLQKCAQTYSAWEEQILYAHRTMDTVLVEPAFGYMIVFLNGGVQSGVVNFLPLHTITALLISTHHEILGLGRSPVSWEVAGDIRNSRDLPFCLVPLSRSPSDVPAKVVPQDFDSKFDLCITDISGVSCSLSEESSGTTSCSVVDVRRSLRGGPGDSKCASSTVSSREDCFFIASRAIPYRSMNLILDALRLPFIPGGIVPPLQCHEPQLFPTPIPGVFCVTDFITATEHAAIEKEIKFNLVENVDGMSASTSGGETGKRCLWEPLSKRQVLHCNRRFYYGSNDLGDLGMHLRVKNPSFYDFLVQRLADGPANLSGPWPVSKDYRCDQLTMNRYDYGEASDSPVVMDSEHDAVVPPLRMGGSSSKNSRDSNQRGKSTASGIAPHVDSHSAFGGVIFSLSLGSHTVMDFQNSSTVECRVLQSVFIPPRALLIMTGEGRYGWTHSIAEKFMDIVQGQPLKRRTRTSLTFRRGRVEEHQKKHCCFPHLCDAA